MSQPENRKKSEDPQSGFCCGMKNSEQIEGWIKESPSYAQDDCLATLYH